MLVSIVLIGGNYDWFWGWRSRQIQISYVCFCWNKRYGVCPKIVGNIFGGQCCAHLLNGWSYLPVEVLTCDKTFGPLHWHGFLYEQMLSRLRSWRYVTINWRTGMWTPSALRSWCSCGSTGGVEKFWHQRRWTSADDGSGSCGWWDRWEETRCLEAASFACAMKHCSSSMQER